MGKLYAAGEMATKLLNNIMTTHKNSILMAFIPQCQKASFCRFQFLKTIYDGSLAVEMFCVHVLYVSKIKIRRSLFIRHFLHRENRSESPRGYLQTVNVIIVIIAKQERNFSCHIQ